MEQVYDIELGKVRVMMQNYGGIRKAIGQIKSRKKMEKIRWMEMFGEKVEDDYSRLWENISGLSNDIEIKVEYGKK